MSGAEVNLYELLELDPSVLDWPAVEARISEVRERWSSARTEGNARQRARAAEVLEQLADAADKLRDEGFRRAEAEALRRRREGEAAEVLARLDEAVALLGGGRCSRAQLERLLAQFGERLPAEAVLERLRAAGVEPPGPRLRPVEGRLDPAAARKLRDQLDLLGLRDLYALLGLGEEAAPEELCRRAEELWRAQAQAPKADAATTARRNLLTAALRLFADAAGKQRYDRQRLYEQVSALDPRLELAGAGGSLGAAQVEALVAAAAALGVPARVARDYVWEVAEENGWRVEPPAGPVPAPEPATRGAGGAEPRPAPGPADDAAARTARPGGAEAGAEARRERAPAALRGRLLAASLLLAAGGTGALAYVAGLPPFAATAPAAASAAAQAAIPAAVAPAVAGGTAAATGGVAAGGLAPTTGTAAAGGPPPAPAGGAAAAGGPLPAPAGAAPPPAPPGPSALPSPRGWRGSGTAAPPAPHAFPAPASPAPPPAPAAWPATPSVALVAEGDRRLAAPMASHLAAELERRGLHVLDRDSSLLLDAWTEGAPLAPLLRRLQGDGVAFLVRVRVEALGERSSRFLGRSEVAVASRLAVDAFLVPDQSGLGAGWDARVDYGEGDADRRAATLARDAAASLAPRLDAAWSDYRNRAGLGAVP